MVVIHGPNLLKNHGGYPSWARKTQQSVCQSERHALAYEFSLCLSQKDLDFMPAAVVLQRDFAGLHRPPIHAHGRRRAALVDDGNVIGCEFIPKYHLK